MHKDVKMMKQPPSPNGYIHNCSIYIVACQAHPASVKLCLVLARLFHFKVLHPACLYMHEYFQMAPLLIFMSMSIQPHQNIICFPPI